MIKFRAIPIIAGLMCGTLFSYGSVRIGNVRDNWRTWPGKIDTLRVDVTEQELMCRVTHEFTFRDPMPDSSAFNDSLEIQVYLRLPENSAVDSLHLWIDNKPVPGLLLSASSASAIYESIVKRRKDPALMTTWGGNDYYLRIFPVMRGQSRTVRIGYHCPMNARTASRNIRVPMNFTDTVGRFELHVKSSRDISGFPVVSEPAALVLGPLAGSSRVLEKLAVGNRISFPLNYLQLSWGDWPAKTDIAACYSTDKSNMGYFSLLLDPFSLLGMKERPPISLSIAWTPSMIETWGSGTAYSYTYSECFEGERRALREFIGTALQQTDKFTLCYAGSTLQSFSKTLVPATTANKSAADGFIANCKPLYYEGRDSYYYDAAGLYHYLPNPPPTGRNWLSALFQAFESFQSSDAQPVVLVLDKGNAYRAIETRASVSALDSVSTAICIRNKRGALMYVITNYARLALYKKLAERFGGRVINSWSGDDMDARLSELIPDIFSVPLTSLSIQVSTGNGSPALDVLGVPSARIPWNNRILLSGRTPQTDLLTVRIAGESNGAYVSAEKSAPVSLTADRSPEKIWAVNKINSAPYYYYWNYYGSDSDDMVAFSLQHNVLTRYSALLALEPGMDTAFAGSEQNSSGWGIRTTMAADVAGVSAFWGGSVSSGGSEFPDIDEVEAAAPRKTAALISVSPNPFSIATRITLALGDVENAQVKIAIYDITGKKVHAFSPVKNAKGLLTVAWNGRDSKGSRLPQGIYFLKVDFGTKMLTQKIVMMQ